MTTQRQAEAASIDEIFEQYYERNLTDGLPIIPPTAARVQAMLATVKRDPQESLGAVAPKWGQATIQKIAINAVMAGCLPEYFPVVVTAVECILEESMNMLGVQATTNPVSPAVMVNGPIRHELKMNNGYNVYGEGNRANSTIGRALRLVLRNIGGGIPGDLDRSTNGWPGRALCFAENEEANPWTTYAEDQGFSRNTNTVTTFSVGGFMNLGDHHSTTGLGLLQHFCRILGNGAGDPYARFPVISLCPEFVQLLVEDGFNKEDVKKYLFENGRIRASGFPQPVGEEYLRARNEMAEKAGSTLPKLEMDSWIPFANSANDIALFVAGGAGRHSALLIPSFGGAAKATKEIKT